MLPFLQLSLLQCIWKAETTPPHNCPFPWQDPGNTWFTRVHSPNDISIGSAVLHSSCLCPTDTDRQTDHAINRSRLMLCIAVNGQTTVWGKPNLGKKISLQLQKMKLYTNCRCSRYMQHIHRRHAFVANSANRSPLSGLSGSLSAVNSGCHGDDPTVAAETAIVWRNGD